MAGWLANVQAAVKKGAVAPGLRSIGLERGAIQVHVAACATPVVIVVIVLTEGALPALVGGIKDVLMGLMLALCAFGVWVYKAPTGEPPLPAAGALPGGRAAAAPPQPQLPSARTINDGDVVYVRTATEPSYYLAMPVNGTYCVCASTNQVKRNRYRITFGVCVDSRRTSGFRLESIDNNYIVSCRYVYNATTGSAKYDNADNHNSKQWFTTNPPTRWPGMDENQAAGLPSLQYGTTYQIKDIYTESRIAVNETSRVKPRRYTRGDGCVWVEAKYPKDLMANFLANFVFERAT